MQLPCLVGVMRVQPSGRIPIIVSTATANTNCTIETKVDYNNYLGKIRYDLALCCSHILGFVQFKHPIVMRSALVDAVNDKCANHRKTKSPKNFSQVC